MRKDEPTPDYAWPTPDYAWPPYPAALAFRFEVQGVAESANSVSLVPESGLAEAAIHVSFVPESGLAEAAIHVSSVPERGWPLPRGLTHSGQGDWKTLHWRPAVKRS